jgi:heptosyltransferase-2
MAQPLLARLREQLPGARLEVLATPWVAAILRRMPEVDELLETELRHGSLQLRERWRLGRALKARGYRQAIVLPNTWKAALAPLLADIPLRSGYVGELRYGLLNRLYRSARRREPMALHYARLAEPPGKDPQEPLSEPRLIVDRALARGTASRFGLEPRYAVFCPGAEYGPAKRWPYFAELATRITVPTVILGSAAERAAAECIAARNLAGETTLDEAIELIAGAEFVVTNDSGLMHVAAAVGTPQVALFGSSSPKHTPPLAANARTVWLAIACSPCFARQCPLGHFRCMKEIPVERVLAEIGLLTSRPEA